VSRFKSRPASTEELTHKKLVVLATFLAGGDSGYVDTEDVAVAAAKLAPGRFAWRKYPEQIDIDAVRRRLVDVARPEFGGFITGSERQGWLLTEAGSAFVRDHEAHLQGTKEAHVKLSRGEQTWLSRERSRMMGEMAFGKWRANEIASITAVEAERFFRIDDYVIGKARVARVERALNAFRIDPELGPAIEAISKLVRDR
jgi:hypothetical protein